MSALATTHARAGWRLGRALAAVVTTDRVYQTVVCSALFALGVKRGISDPDLPWHLKTGELIARLHWVPTADVFSSTHAGAPFIAYSWLPELVMWLLTTLIGFHALRIATGLVVAWTFVLVYRTCRDVGAVPALALGVSLVAGIATLPFVAERPTIVSFLLAAFFARRLTAYLRGDPVRLWPLVPATVLWANVHVFFVYAVAWTCLAAGWAFVRERILRQAAARGRWPALAIAGVACAAATLANPYGWTLLGHVRILMSHPATLPITELASPNFHITEVRVFLLFLLAFIAAYAWTSERPDPFAFGLALANLALALDVQRNIPVFVIVAAPLLARAASRTRVNVLFAPPGNRLTPAHALAHSVFALAFVGLAVVRMPTAAGFEANSAERAWPFEAARFVRAQPPLGRMVNGYNWGGFLIYALPEYPVTIDGRATFYGEPEVLRMMRLVYGTPGWRAVLREIAPDFVFWERKAPLAVALAGDPHWTKAYADDRATVFIRGDHPLRRAVKLAGRRWLRGGRRPR